MRVRGMAGAAAAEVARALEAVLDGASTEALGLGIDPTDAETLDVPDGTAAVVATSGSTGVPKRVVLGRDALLASARATAARVGEGTWLLALSPGYVAGLQVLTRSFVAGTTPVLLDGPFDPAAFAAAAERMVRPALTSLVPAQLARLLDSGVALDGFAAILVGGQRLDPALRERARHAGARIVRTYGSTETAGGCVYDGTPLDGVAVRVADGEVQVAGTVLAAGYLDDDDAATAAAFTTDPDGTRWYRTGDTGDLRDGVLTVTGRRDDVYVTGGVNVSIARVEDAVRSVPGLEHAVVVAVPDERWGEASVVVTTDAHAEALLDPARDAVAAAVGRHARPAGILIVDRIPELASGKPDRVALRGLGHG